MQEHEIWLTEQFNRFLPGPANAILDVFKVKHDAAQPWANWMSMEVLIVAVIVVIFAILRSRLSVDNPGRLQHIFEVVFDFLNGQAGDYIDHHASKYVDFCTTLFIFILFMNLVGVIPGLESPTMYPMVPLGCALSVLAYYNWMGLREQGLFGYMKHFAGPMPWLAPLMVPIEVISHLARPLSLTIRLYANMFAGEQVTMAFLALTYLLVPSLFMGLHVFVGFLQAYVFALLTLIYVGAAVAHEH
jgi:F-type H+-transporting ATPase subunit a